MPLWSDICYNANPRNVDGLGGPAIDEGQKQRPGFPAGAQQATPAIDRQSLEQAIASYDDIKSGRGNTTKCFDTIIAAARAHLETLPKFVWHVTASKYWSEGTMALPPFATEDREKAAVAAVSFLKQGYTNVGVRRVQS